MDTKTEIAIFGGGCFWCTEAVFKMLKGISKVEPGYMGGKNAHPTYSEVSAGDTGHVEVTRVEYDPSEIAFRDLLTVFFGSHDATQLNRQGNDIGTQYRSVVFYSTDTQKKETETFIEELQQSAKEGEPIVTTVEPASEFYPAEDYHKNYYEAHKDQGYCQVIIAPKLAKVQKEFAHLLAAHPKQ
ncbi:peptide-methionine (S)-S-oxide reductase MsrA [Candidatus Parcubacteria bacterium]|nr:peptide-methionine (S)-S-oxide reductase MsrA [Candidatus Parcubacteria bacterium]